MKKSQKIVLSVWPLIANFISPLNWLINGTSRGCVVTNDVNSCPITSGALTMEGLFTKSVIVLYMLLLTGTAVIFYRLTGRKTQSILGWVAWSFLVALIEAGIFIVLVALQSTIGV